MKRFALALLLVGCRGGAGLPEEDAQVWTDGGGTFEASPDVGPIDAGHAAGQVDRAGRPLVSVLLVAQQDGYNAVPTFESTLPPPMQTSIESRLVMLDTIAIGDAGPDPVDWAVPDGGTHPLLAMFTTDALLVDTTRSCTLADGGWTASYLDIERESFLAGPAHATCGGRTPNENVVDETLTLLVTAGRAPVSQGVAAATKPASTKFPYLAEPN